MNLVSQDERDIYDLAFADIAETFGRDIYVYNDIKVAKTTIGV